MRSSPQIVTFFAATLLAASAFDPTSRAQSPFLPSGGAQVAAPVESGTYELVGMISSGSQTLVGITDLTAKKSSWIPVGKTVNGIEVVSCEAKNDRATIRVGGQLRTLTMRPTSPTGGSTTPARPVVTANAPVLPASPSTTAPATPNSAKQAEEEREARMLVSDLLEIGMQQRKAYEEAQRKAQHPQRPASPAPSR